MPKCPDCQTELSIADAQGKAIVCPGCGRHFEVRRTKKCPPPLPDLTTDASPNIESLEAVSAEAEPPAETIQADTVQEKPETDGTDEPSGWYVQIGVIPKGPLTDQELVSLVECGELHHEHFVRYGSNTEWKKAASVVELKAHFNHRAEALRRTAVANEAESLPPVISAPEYIEEGARVVRTLHIVTARRVYGSNIWKDFLVDLRDLVGGRSKTAEKLLFDTENELIEILQKKAKRLGADALIDLRMQFGDMGGGRSTMFFGTAHATPVVLERVDDGVTEAPRETEDPGF